MKTPLVVNRITQKMLAYQAFMSVFVPETGPLRPLGARPDNFDRVCQMLGACSIGLNVGGHYPTFHSEHPWMECAAGAYRAFPFTARQMHQMSVFHAKLRHVCRN